MPSLSSELNVVAMLPTDNIVVALSFDNDDVDDDNVFVSIVIVTLDGAEDEIVVSFVSIDIVIDLDDAVDVDDVDVGGNGHGDSGQHDVGHDEKQFDSTMTAGASGCGALTRNSLLVITAPNAAKFDCESVAKQLRTATRPKLTRAADER